ncbi:MAG: hypothetical protein ACI841_001519 [Planctomycetota bacterium]|jgi:hypothetical protein
MNSTVNLRLAPLLLSLLPSVAIADNGLECDGDYCRLILHEFLTIEGPSGMFEAKADGGFTIDGQVVLSTLWMEFPLPEVHLSGRPMQVDGPLDFEVISTVRPEFSALPGIGSCFTGGLVASFGIATREVVREVLQTGDSVLPLPENYSLLDPNLLLEPTYFYFHFEAGVELDLPLTDALGVNFEALGEYLGYELPEVEATLIIDPTDPFFYLALDSMLSSVAITIGANYEASVGIEASGMGITLPLGQASLAMHLTPFDTQIDFSGELYIENIQIKVDGTVGAFLPDEIPMGLSDRARVAGFIHENGLGHYEAGYMPEGQFTASPLGLQTWQLGVDGSLSLNAAGYELSGTLMGYLHPALQFDGEVGVEASLPFDYLSAWHIGAHGRLTLAGSI